MVDAFNQPPIHSANNLSTHPAPINKRNLSFF